MKNILLVTIGCAIGGSCRYLVTLFIYRLHFPCGILIVNAIGSFFAGFLVILIFHQYPRFTQALYCLLIVGFLGGFTTFSAFSINTMTLFEKAFYLRGLLYIFLSTSSGITAAWIGMMIGKKLYLLD